MVVLIYPTNPRLDMRGMIPMYSVVIDRVFLQRKEYLRRAVLIVEISTVQSPQFLGQMNEFSKDQRGTSLRNGDRESSQHRNRNRGRRPIIGSPGKSIGKSLESLFQDYKSGWLVHRVYPVLARGGVGGEYSTDTPGPVDTGGNEEPREKRIVIRRACR